MRPVGLLLLLLMLLGPRLLQVEGQQSRRQLMERVERRRVARREAEGAEWIQGYTLGYGPRY